MKGLSLWQPYATLIAIGAKTIETRSWGTTFRGLLAIHATKAFPASAKNLCMGTPFMDALMCAGYSGTYELPRAAIVAVANLHRVGEIRRGADGAVIVHGRELPIEGDELAFGDYTPGRRGWVLTNVGALKDPVPCKGARGLWDVPPDVLALLAAQGMGQ
jgi:activating signal cointegrator 1